MATQDGIAVTYAASTATYKELLLALYTSFNAGDDANWQIKAGVTVPTIIASTGDTGFVLEDVATQTINIAIADHNGVGGLMLDGGAVSTSDEIVCAIDPSGGITNITSGGWAVGARMSGWAADTQGAVYSSLAGRSIIVSGTDWLMLRHKNTTTGYDGGVFAGKYLRLDEGIGDGFCLFGGLWIDMTSQSANIDHCGIESLDDGTWINTPRLFPLNTGGLTGDYASDGAGTWRLCPVSVAIPSGAFSTPFSNWAIAGTIPALYSGPNGTAATQWKTAGAVVKAVCMDGGAWLCRSDGVVAE